MPDDYTIKINMKNIEGKISAAINVLADEILERASDNIMNYKPYAIFDTSDLLKSGAIEKLDDTSFSVTFGGGTAQVKYAKFVEYGTSPHFPPIDPLKKWAGRRLNLKEKEAERAAWAIAVKMSKEGTEPKPYLRPAVDFVVNDAQAIIEKGISRYL
jgi:hypothetical protein